MIQSADLFASLAFFIRVTFHGYPTPWPGCLSLLPKRQYNLRRSSFRQGRCRCGVAELIDPHRMTSYGLLDDDDDGAVALFIGTSAAVIVIIVARQGLCALG